MSETHAKVLIVDDHPSNMAVLIQTLADVGYEIYAAERPSEALAIVEETIPHICLIDIMLPEMDGYELCAKLKENPHLVEVPVIFITSRSSTTDILKGLKAGAVDYITKPFHRFEVLARIRTHIRLFEAMQEIARLHKLALDANPLTQLPGNNSIMKTIQNSIDEQKDAVVIYTDLDNFKAYNDRYGFMAGDKVILFAAFTIKSELERLCDGDGFLGHIGGDDYVMIAPAEKAEALGQSIAMLFDAGIVEFYNEEDKERGYAVIRNRKGEFEKFPFVAISMAAVRLKSRNFESVHEVSSICAELKKVVKKKTGSVYLCDRRTHDNKTEPVQSGQ